MRKCSRCNIIKTSFAFSFKHKLLGTRNSICRACHAEYTRAYAQRTDRLKRNQRIRKNTRAHRERNRQFIQDFKRKRSCVDCSERDPLLLEFDHVRGVKTASISDMARSPVSIELLIREIAKCELRCGNCHRIKTLERMGATRNPKAMLEVQSR